jgi:23S rRNA (uridine2552-2'-O)-methyltransferase
MRLQEARKDLYRRLARERGYKSRAAFKLIEAQERYKLIRTGDKVIDFGAAPGGWVQVSSEIVGDSGLVVGVDRDTISLRKGNIHTLRVDVFEESLAENLAAIVGGKADVVLSDLAPSVSGAWDLDQYKQAELTLRVLQLSVLLLRRGGNGFIKLFEGERTKEVRMEFSRRFDVVRAIKPRASRSQASELFYACLGWRGLPESPRDTERTAATTSA